MHCPACTFSGVRRHECVLLRNAKFVMVFHHLAIAHAGHTVRIAVPARLYICSSFFSGRYKCMLLLHQLFNGLCSPVIVIIISHEIRNLLQPLRRIAHSDADSQAAEYGAIVFTVA